MPRKVGAPANVETLANSLESPAGCRLMLQATTAKVGGGAEDAGSDATSSEEEDVIDLFLKKKAQSRQRTLQASGAKRLKTALGLMTTVGPQVDQLLP